MDASLPASDRSASFTSNQTHVAFAQSGSIYVGNIDSCGSFEKRCASLRPHPFGLRPILALSPLTPNLLSVSTASRTSIWDVEDDLLKHTIHDSERSVTSSAWSNHDADLLALGHVDGHISLWNVQHVVRPQRVFSVGTARCQVLSWSIASPSILAACCGEALLLWNANTPHAPLIWRCDLGYPAANILWRPRSCTNFWTIDSNGTLEEWSTDDLAAELSDSDDDQDQDLFGDLDDMKPNRTASSLYQANIPAGCHVSAVGNDGVLILDRRGRTLQAYQDLQHIVGEDPAWSRQLMFQTEHLIVVAQDDTVKIVTAGSQGMEVVRIPPEAFDRFGVMPYRTSSREVVDLSQTDDTLVYTKTLKAMNPTKVRSIPDVETKSGRKARLLRADMRSLSSFRPATSDTAQANSSTFSAVSPRAAMASSLELPQIYDEDSPMPFLSPTIPSRRPSPSAIPALGDDIILPPPETESFGSLPSTAMNDSDSDDETFDGDALRGSGTLVVPGGANVPLPKSCGAFFSPNGQLITFFPPKARVKAAKVNGLSSTQPEAQTTKASRLFPLFGNLSVEARDYEDSDSDSVLSGDDTATHDSPRADILSFPTPGDGSWPDRLEHMQTLTHDALGKQNIIVSVLDVNDLIYFRPDLARSYRTSCDSEDSAGDASAANADVARAAGLEHSASIWSLLALILRDALPVELLTSAGTDIIGIARRASRFIQAGHGARPAPSGQSSLLPESNWPQSKVGANWLVKQIFAWVELRADVQMLACLSAVLLSSAQSKSRPSKISVVISDSRSSLPASDYFANGISHGSQPLSRATPVLHADSRDGSFLNRSPAKPHHSSHVSSRNPSQPTTPYVDSLSSTPPFPFPKLSRQGSRLSASGSASPETHRSSFGAAAKFYAQSITDKISSYGTSPPARRFGTSPNNELSSSLPGAGSWSKSVSFASVVDRDNRSSARLAAPDDNDYDSDRTIEDTSLPHTPKRHFGPISFNLKNTGAFAPSKEPQTQLYPPSLLSPSLTAKARIWIGHYTEQLRRLDMKIEATELDNIARPCDDTAASQSKLTGVYPMPAVKSRKLTCSICRCKIQGVQQVCSRCLHTTHISCLSSFMEACGSEEMECPTGCGCSCALVAFEETPWDAAAEASAPQTVRRQWSFTDPRRWREQVQGDSW